MISELSTQVGIMDIKLNPLNEHEDFMHIFRRGEPNRLPTRCTNCSSPLTRGSYHMENGNRFYSAHCQEGQLCRRFSVWLLVPKRTPFREPGDGVLSVDLFRVMAVNSGFLLQVRDQFKSEINFPVKLMKPYFSETYLDQVKTFIERMLYYVQWSDELFLGVELWFHLLFHEKNPGVLFPDCFEWAFQQVVGGVSEGGISLYDAERCESLASEVEAWLNR